MKLWERVNNKLNNSTRARVPAHMPTSLTLITTYRCTAALRSCFGGNPQEKSSLSVDEIRKHIAAGLENASESEVGGVYRGECCLEGLARAAVATASECGFASRCVTNGYWAVSKDSAAGKMALLKKAGLTEINFSTGDEHQKFVSFERIVWGATSAAEAGIKSLIAVEGSAESAFSIHEALNHPGIEDFMRLSPFRKNLSFLTNVWIPFQKGVKI